MADSFQPDSFVADSFAPSTKKKYSRGFFKTYEGAPSGVAQKADVAAGSAANFLVNLVNAPYEAAGEAITAPIEQRAPILPTVFGGEGAANPVSTVNKLLRAGAGAVSGLSSGTPGESAQVAYNAPRGTLGTVEDTAMGLLMGAVAPEVASAPLDAVINAPGEIARTVKNVGSAVIPKVIRVGFGPTEEAQAIIQARPQDVARQTTFSDLGDKLAETTNGLKSQLTELDNQAWDTLLGLKAEPQSRLISILNKVKKQFTGTGNTKIGNADKQAAAQIDKYIERIQQISGDKYNAANPGTEKFLDQPQLKEIIQSIQADADYTLPDSNPVNRAVQGARAGIDKYLKDQNPDYETAMVPVADATAALKDTVRRFRLEHKTNEGFLPTKTTVDRLTALPKDKSPEIARTVDQLKNTTGVDFADEAKLTSVKEQFQPGERTRGSARTAAGALLGMAAEPLVPGPHGLSTFLGGALGRTADYYGGPMAASILDLLGQSKTGVGNVLSAVNAKTQGTPYQDIIARIIAGQPALSPLLRQQ